MSWILHAKWEMLGEMTCETGVTFKAHGTNFSFHIWGPKINVSEVTVQK
jgi:hypothetical protein